MDGQCFEVFRKTAEGKTERLEEWNNIFSASIQAKHALDMADTISVRIERVTRETFFYASGPADR